MRSRQGGAGGFLIAVVLLLAITAFLAMLAFLRSSGQNERTTQDSRRFDAIKASLAQFVATNGRLPCPTNPATDTGDAVPDAPSATCTNPQGTVPWRTLGIRREDAIDAWGWKISYRVYTGAAGSLTQAEGASMVNCDTTEAAGWSAGRTPVVGSAGGLCRGTRNTTPAEFIAGKGLQLNYFGTPVTDAAYVLVSHGPSGLGAWTSVPPSTQTSLPASASELSNLNAAGPFVATNATLASVSPTNAAHFDDVLAYQSVSELIRLAGRGARNWDDTAQANVTLDTATLTSALGAAPNANLGVNSINFETARVTGLSGATAQELTFDADDGLGTASGASSISLGESIRIEFQNKATQFAVTLNHFGTVSFFGTWREQVRFDFYNDNVQVMPSVTKQGCRADGGRASFSIDRGAAQFDRVEIVPILSTVHPFFGSVITSSFWLAAFKTCLSGVCQTDLHTAGNVCP